MGRDPRASEGYATFKNGRPDILRRLCLIVAVAAFAPGCGSTPLTPSPAPLHLYVVNAAQPSGVLQFNLPLTTTTTPNFLMAWNSPGAVPDSIGNLPEAVAVDAGGNLAVGDRAGYVQFFMAPISATNLPSAIFDADASVPTPFGVDRSIAQMTFTNAGDLWLGAGAYLGRVNAFTHPFSNASAPSTFVTDASLSAVVLDPYAVGTAFDAAQNLYVADVQIGTYVTCSSGAGTCSRLLVYAPPYTGAPIATPNVPVRPTPPPIIVHPFVESYRRIAVSETQLFAAWFPAIPASSSVGRIDVFNLPITSSSTPAFSLVSGNNPIALALDPSGNLYVGNLSDATVTVYSPPITSVSVPSLIFKTGPYGSVVINDIAVGR